MFEDSYFYKHGHITASELARVAEFWQDDPMFFVFATFVMLIITVVWAFFVWVYILLFFHRGFRAQTEANMGQRITPLGMYILFMVIWGFGSLMNYAIFGHSSLSYVLHSILGNTLHFWLGQIQWSFFSLGILEFIF